MEVFVHKSALLILSLGKILERRITESSDLTNEIYKKWKGKHNKLKKPHCLTHFHWASNKHPESCRAAAAAPSVLGRRLGPYQRDQIRSQMLGSGPTLYLHSWGSVDLFCSLFICDRERAAACLLGKSF